MAFVSSPAELVPLRGRITARGAHPVHVAAWCGSSDPTGAARHLPSDPALSTVEGRLYLDTTPPSLEFISSSPAETHVVRIRPVYGDARVNEPVPSWHAQSEGQKTIFATLGTVNNRNQLLLRKHLEAVADQDYQVRMALGDAPTAAVPTALKSRTTNSLKSVPVNVRPESVLANVRPESLRANVHVERYVPVSQAVPTCAAVVSHGGRGTVLTALSHGVPVCSIPIFADQPVTASLVERFGAGLTCATGQVQMGPFALPVADPQELDPLHLRHQIQRTLTEPTFAEQARAIQSEIAELPGPEQVVHLMETVLAEAHHRPARGTLTQSPPA